MSGFGVAGNAVRVFARCGGSGGRGGLHRDGQRRVERLFGYRPDELLGTQVEILVPDSVKAPTLTTGRGS